MSNDCLFCKVVARELPSTVVYEDEDLLAFRDINPQAPTHILVVPKRHIGTVNELAAGDAELVGRLVLRARALAAEEGIDEPGYRLILNCNPQGGQTVYHLHLHLMGGRQMVGLG